MKGDIQFAQVMPISTASVFGAALSTDRFIVAIAAFVGSIIATRYLNVCIEEKVEDAR